MRWLCAMLRFVDQADSASVMFFLWSAALPGEIARDMPYTDRVHGRAVEYFSTPVPVS